MSKFKSHFKVGDRVVTYEPVIVGGRYTGIMGKIDEVFEDFLHIEYPDGGVQICHPEDDKLQHAPEVEIPVVDEKPLVSNVEHPSHYNQDGIECIEAIKASLGKEFPAYCKGNVMKYLWRYSYKNGLEDLKKAQVYLKWMVEAVEKETKDEF